MLSLKKCRLFWLKILQRHSPGNIKRTSRTRQERRRSISSPPTITGARNAIRPWIPCETRSPNERAPRENVSGKPNIRDVSGKILLRDVRRPDKTGDFAWEGRKTLAQGIYLVQIKAQRGEAVYTISSGTPRFGEWFPGAQEYLDWSAIR